MHSSMVSFCVHAGIKLLPWVLVKFSIGWKLKATNRSEWRLRAGLGFREREISEKEYFIAVSHYWTLYEPCNSGWTPEVKPITETCILHHHKQQIQTIYIRHHLRRRKMSPISIYIIIWYLQDRVIHECFLHIPIRQLPKG